MIEAMGTYPSYVAGIVVVPGRQDSLKMSAWATV